MCATKSITNVISDIIGNYCHYQSIWSYSIHDLQLVLLTYENIRCFSFYNLHTSI